MKLFIAQGFGSGRASRAPGTFGSLVGLMWFALLLLPGNAWAFILGVLASTAAAVWLCGEAEKILGTHDPGSVVLDEIIALPICFAAPLVFHTLHHGFPNLAQCLHSWPWWWFPAIFAAFRFFDIAKPWPVKQSQRLPGGLGVVADDVIAALWVNAISLPVLAF
ncbi:MAG: phosphatidylglycerophosphatase A [Verrucomicrobiales bacterium]|nr:phosphatidylglycerophosphatase A [Verrucomicrobiales bacterium]